MDIRREEGIDGFPRGLAPYKHVSGRKRGAPAPRTRAVIAVGALRAVELASAEDAASAAVRAGGYRRRRSCHLGAGSRRVKTSRRRRATPLGAMGAARERLARGGPNAGACELRPKSAVRGG